MAKWTYNNDYTLTSPFGFRIHPISKVRTFHRGIDLVVAQPNGFLYAFVAGTVRWASHGLAGVGMPPEMGNVVAIEDKDGYYHVYAHLHTILVKIGDKVEYNQVIGRQGTTGNSTGNHLHYEIRKTARPHNGWTSTEAGVVEPTQYLMDYYRGKPEEDEPMTKTEKEYVKKLEERLEALEKRLNISGKETYANGYVDAISAAKSAGAITTSAEKSKIELNVIQMLFNLGLFKKK